MQLMHEAHKVRKTRSTWGPVSYCPINWNPFFKKSCFQVPYLLYLPGVTTMGTPHSLMLDAPEALVSPPEIKPLHYKTIMQTPAICSNIDPLSSTNRLTLSQQLTFKPKGNLQSPVNLTTLTACPWEIARVRGRTHAHTGRMRWLHRKELPASRQQF